MSDPMQKDLITKAVSQVKMSAEECRTLCRKAGVKYLDGYEDRVFVYTITDETVDRYGDIIRAKGGDFKNYKRNPVVLTFHNYKAFPVGSALKVWVDETGKRPAMKAWALFYDDRVDRTGIADTAYRFVAAGALRTVSVGILPTDDGVRRPDDEERKALGLGRHGVVIEKWELLEFSVTPVPANPNALNSDLTRRGMYSIVNIEQARADGIDKDIADACERILQVGVEAMTQREYFTFTESAAENTEADQMQVQEFREELQKGMTSVRDEVLAGLKTVTDSLVELNNAIADLRDKAPATASGAADDDPDEAEVRAFVTEITKQFNDG